MQKKACNTLNPMRLFYSRGGATNRANSWRFDLKEKALSLEWRKGFFYGE